MSVYFVECPCGVRFPVDSETMRAVKVGVVVSDEDYRAAMGLDPEPAA